jgi:hypothetical protein
MICVVDPVEQARIGSDWEAQWREELRGRPASGPTPAHLILLDVLPLALTMQIGELLSGWRRWMFAGVAMALMSRSIDVVVRGQEASARRRGVERVGDGPDWPPPRLVPTLAVAVGIATMVHVRPRRNAHPGEGIVWALAMHAVEEAHRRWRWRHHPVLRD